MTEPQVWTLIGVFAASMLGMMTFMATSTRSMIDGLRKEMRAGFDKIEGVLDARFEKVEARADSDRAEMRAGFAKIETKIDHLDRDISTLYCRNFEDPR